MVILQSRGINEQMVERFHLRTRYKKKLMEDAIKELKAHARFKQTAAGTIQISVEDTDRQRAADMANSMSNSSTSSTAKCERARVGAPECSSRGGSRRRRGRWQRPSSVWPCTRPSTRPSR
jgi:capsular polysaccharide biosynthesis protein